MSIDNQHDDAEFERFLAGEGELSLQLMGLPQVEPSAELDAAVFASIEAAMAAEKVQLIEPDPRGAANDPVGPASASSQRRRSLAYYWHWPVGVAAGILLTLAYRSAFDPYHPAPLALNDSMQSRVISPTPHVTAQPDVTSEPGRVAMAPAVIEPPDVAPEPALPAPAAAAVQPLVASAKEGAAPTGALNAEEKKTQVVVTGSAILRQDRETASPVQVLTAEGIRSSPSKQVAEPTRSTAPDLASGVELAWTRDPAQQVIAPKAAPHTESPMLAAMRSPPAAAPAPMLEIEAAKPAIARADYAAASSRPSASSTSNALSLRASSPEVPGLTDQPSSGYVAATPAPAPDLGARGLASVPVDASRPEASREYKISVGNDQDAVAAQTVERVEVSNTGYELRKQALIDEAHADPRKWLALIEKEIEAKHDQAALAEWNKFVAAHPAYEIGKKLRTAIESLRARAQLQPAESKKIEEKSPAP